MDNVLVKLRRKLLLKIVLGALLGILIWLFFVILIDSVLQSFLADTVSEFSRPLYYFLKNYKTEVLYIFLFAIAIFAIYFILASALRYLNLIVGSIDKVFKKDEALIELPSEFQEIANKLNAIKFDMLKNEQVAKQAEERKNDLVVYLAHDLKTPLTSVIGYLSLLSEADDMPAEQRKKYVSISLNKAEHLESLINEFFEITRFNLQNIILNIGQVNLSLLLLQLTDEFYPLLSQKNLSCKTDIEPDIIISGDGERLARVFDNILKNAINYSYENGCVEITAKHYDSGIKVEFRNQGVQIPKEKLNSIFEKFYRLDSARSSQTGGAGLGLAIAKKIVELHNGHITAESSPEYTEFTVTLPENQN